MFAVLNAVFDEKYNVSTKQSYIRLSQQLPFNESQSSKQLVSKIKTNLISLNTRLEGLLLLSTYINEGIPDNSLYESENLIFWCQTCLKQIQQSNDSQIDRKRSTISCEVLSNIFDLISNTSDIALNNEVLRELSTSVAPQLIDAIINCQYMSTSDALKCLTCTLSAFPRSCASKRRLIELFIIKNVIKDKDLNHIKYLALCFAKLPKCGISGNQGMNLQNSWKEYLNRTLFTIISLLKIYEVLGKNTYVSDQSFENDSLVPIIELNKETDIVLNSIETLRKIRFAGFVICSLITDSFPYPIAIPIETILDVVKHMCGINGNDIKGKDYLIDANAISFILPSIHEIAFDILEALLLSCKSALIIHSQIINTIIMQSLEWTKDLKEIQIKPYNQLRIRIYSFIERWCSICGYNSNISSDCLKILINHFIFDIKPIESVVKLQNISTKKNHKSISNKNNENSFNFVNLSNFELYYSTLKALKTFLYSYGAFINNADQSLLHKEVIHLLLLIYRTLNNVPKPYEKEECRKELLNVLFSQMMNSNDLILTSLGLCITIFSNAEKIDESIIVKQFCTESLVILNLIMNSRLKIYPTNLCNTQSQSVLSNTEPMNIGDEIEETNDENEIIVNRPVNENHIDLNIRIETEVIQSNSENEQCIDNNNNNNEEHVIDNTIDNNLNANTENEKIIDKDNSDDCIIVEENITNKRIANTDKDLNINETEIIKCLSNNINENEIIVLNDNEDNEESDGKRDSDRESLPSPKKFKDNDDALNEMLNDFNPVYND